jgi:multidrug efflux system membrane fusion protein
MARRIDQGAVMSKKPIYGLIAFTAAAASAVWMGAGSQSHAAERSAPPSAPEVIVSQVLVRPIDDASQFTGRLQAVDTIDLRPRVSGYVDSVEFKEGALVKKGELLFRIDARPYEAEVARLTANLAEGRSEAALARSNAARATRLLDQHAISKEESETLQSDASSTQSKIAATEAQLANARLNRQFTEIRAPIDGRVSNARVTPGNLVSSADVLTTVVSVNPVYAYFDVDEHAFLKYQDLSRKQGRLPSVSMGLASEKGYPHNGRIDFVDNQLRTEGGTIRLRAVFDNAKEPYTPGLFARIQLLSPDAHPRALIDDRAVGTDLGNKYAYVVDGQGQVQYRAIHTGGMVDGLRVVDDGLTASDRVVVSGLQKVRPGTKVTAKMEPMENRAAVDGPSIKTATVASRQE